MSNGTTFPDYESPQEKGEQHWQPTGEQGGYQGGGQQGGGNNYQPRNNYNGGGQNNYGGNQGGGYNNGGGYQKRQWNGGGQGGGGGYQKRQYGGGGGGGFQRKEETDFSLYKPYAFTANDTIPPDIMEKIVAIMRRLEAQEYTLRTGGMEGPESVAEAAIKKIEVHLPWRDFNNKQSKFTWTMERAKAVAKMFHPAFDSMKKGVQMFLAKNARLILGDKVNSPALFLLTWTEDGITSHKERTAKTGFAGHPIAIASAIGIPVFNFGNPAAFEQFERYIDSVVG